MTGNKKTAGQTAKTESPLTEAVVVPTGFELINKQFERENGEFVNLEIGEVIQGTLKGSFEYDGKFGKNTAYKIESANGLKYIAGCGFLDKNLPEFVGKEVWLKYEGKTDKGHIYKLAVKK